METPLFTIVTATYNASATLERTLKSIAEQSCLDYEHLIIDGASKDDTAQIAARYADPKRIFHSEPDGGLYDAMNKGIAASKGKYLIFLNAGDKFHAPDTLQKIKDAILHSGHPGIVYGQTVIVDDNGTELGQRHLTAPDELTLKSFAQGMLVCHQAFIVLRRIAGFYNLKYRFSADYEWCIRCLQHSRRNKGLTDTVLIDYLSEGITTRNKIPSLIERFKIMAFYYGFFPTLIRHVGFVGRAIKRKIKK